MVQLAWCVSRKSSPGSSPSALSIRRRVLTWGRFPHSMLDTLVRLMPAETARSSWLIPRSSRRVRIRSARSTLITSLLPKFFGKYMPNVFGCQETCAMLGWL